MNDQPAQSNQANSYVDDYNPPTAGSGNKSELLEDQNIFYLLGVTDGSDQERESFLDELQQVIWEDFLENDVRLLITDEEKKELDSLLAKQASTDLEKQEEIVVYLEKLIPDLEEIMLEKALRLKSDLVKERVLGMREYYAGQTTQLNQLQQAEALIRQEKWHSAASLLNSIT